MTLVVPDEVTTDLASMTLEQLADEIGKGHRSVQANLSAAVATGIEVGLRLMEVKSRLGVGEWRPWIEVNIDELSPAQAGVYLRFAYYREVIFESAADSAIVWKDAMKAIKGLPPVLVDHAGAYPAEVRDEAKRLRATGMPYTRIGQEMGIDCQTVKSWCEPGYRAEQRRRFKERARRRRAAEKALREKEHREESDRLAKAQGLGPRLTSLRREAREMDAAWKEAEGDKRAHLKAAYLKIADALIDLDKALRA